VSVGTTSQGDVFGAAPWTISDAHTVLAMEGVEQSHMGGPAHEHGLAPAQSPVERSRKSSAKRSRLSFAQIRWFL
jgi:hypothetical protein